MSFLEGTQGMSHKDKGTHTQSERQIMQLLENATQRGEQSSPLVRERNVIEGLFREPKQAMQIECGELETLAQQRGHGID